MRISCQREELIKGINIVSKAVPAKTPLSSLDCIFIDAAGEVILLSATDTEIGIETEIEGNILEKGSVAINAKMLNDFIKSLPDDEIIIECDSSLKCSISCASLKPKFENIMGKRGDEFLHVPVPEKACDISISQFTLKDLISKTIFSVSDSENNRVMTGELFNIKEGKLRVISMDGHRISIRSTEINDPPEDMKVIIPSKALSEINKILGVSMEEKVNIYFMTNSVIFTFEKTRVYSTLLHGEYFNVDQMLDQKSTTTVVINRQDLLSTLQRAALLVRESDKKPAILNITGGEMEVTINTQMARFDENINILKDGLDLLIGFNPKFLIETLRAIDDEEVSLYFDGKVSPLVVKNKEETYIYLILPVNIMNETR